MIKNLTERYNQEQEDAKRESIVYDTSTSRGIILSKIQEKQTNPKDSINEDTEKLSIDFVEEILEDALESALIKGTKEYISLQDRYIASLARQQEVLTRMLKDEFQSDKDKLIDYTNFLKTILKIESEVNEYLQDGDIDNLAEWIQDKEYVFSAKKYDAVIKTYPIQIVFYIVFTDDRKAELYICENKVLGISFIKKKNNDN